MDPPHVGSVEPLERMGVPAGGQGGLHRISVVPVDGWISRQQRGSGCLVRHVPRWIGSNLGRLQRSGSRYPPVAGVARSEMPARAPTDSGWVTNHLIYAGPSPMD